MLELVQNGPFSSQNYLNFCTVQAHIATDDGDMEVQIVEVNDKVVVLDANHPLAGEDLTFDIEVIDVK